MSSNITGVADGYVIFWVFLKFINQKKSKLVFKLYVRLNAQDTSIY